MSELAKKLQEYHVGDSDQRPWGHYVVTAVGKNAAGEEVCEKDITVNPGQVLSLQSHNLRREHWRVTQGILTVVLDDQTLTLKAGEDVRIPLKGIHCMANLTKEDCIVHEVQEGVCSEDDIIRYNDAYGRKDTYVSDARVVASLQQYNVILERIKAAKAA